MAHQWFGNLVSPKWWDDLLLNEAFAEYMGNRVTTEATEFSEADAWAATARKNWGLTADARPSTHPVAGTGARDADAALQDFDGISYAKGYAVLTQLANRVGDGVFFDGVRAHFDRHRFGNATMHDLFGAWEGAGAGVLDTWTDAWLRTAGVDRLDLDRGPDGGVALVRTPPGDVPSNRTQSVSVAGWDGSGWQTEEVLVDRDRTPVAVAADAPAFVDADTAAWASVTFDDLTAAGLADLMTRTQDPMLRSAIWITVRNGVDHARLDPARAVDILAGGIPNEEHDFALTSLAVWAGDDGEGSHNVVHWKLLPVVADADSARRRLHDAFVARATSAPAGSELQLAAAQGAVLTAPEPEPLRALLAGDWVPGLTVDAGMRWRAFKRLTSLGDTDLDELDKALADDNDAKSQLAHAWCHARLADADAKAWAWQRFTGEAPASNYEIEAIGSGMWQTGRDDLLAPYAARYFEELPGTTAVRQGWVLADAARFFFPISIMTDDTLRRRDELLTDDTLNPTLRRVLIDVGDDLRRRIESIRRFS
jgi:aminopeptidase N